MCKCSCEWKEQVIEVITGIDVVDGKTVIKKEKINVMANKEIGFATDQTHFVVSNEVLLGG